MRREIEDALEARDRRRRRAYGQDAFGLFGGFIVALPILAPLLILAWAMLFGFR